MTKTWLFSDPHFGHDNVYKFTDAEGAHIRRWDDPWECTNAEEGDALMVYWCQKMIAPDDLVWFLGDVAIPRRGLKVLLQIPGRKKLVKGNHDIFKVRDYLAYFTEIAAMVKIDEFCMTHAPLHPRSLPQWCAANLHGHIHERRVLLEDESVDDRYYNCCVEQTGGKPIDLEEIKRKYKREEETSTQEEVESKGNIVRDRSV